MNKKCKHFFLRKIVFKGLKPFLVEKIFSEDLMDFDLKIQLKKKQNEKIFLEKFY